MHRTARAGRAEPLRRFARRDRRVLRDSVCPGCRSCRKVAAVAGNGQVESCRIEQVCRDEEPHWFITRRLPS